MSNAYTQYEQQKKEVNLLLSFHGELHENRTKSAPDSPGRRSSELEVLHKSAIVLLTACWEAYIENTVTEAVTIISKSLKDPFQLHNEILRSIASTKSDKLSISDKHDLYAWYFVGDGWRSILLEFSKLKISELNTPDSSGVRKIMNDLLGIKDISESWGRPGKMAKDAADRLDEYLSDRHVIAHGSVPLKKFSKSYVTNFLGFLAIPVQKTDDEVSNRLKDLGLSIP
jgi:hypothetical protein